MSSCCIHRSNSLNKQKHQLMEKYEFVNEKSLKKYFKNERKDPRRFVSVSAIICSDSLDYSCCDAGCFGCGIFINLLRIGLGKRTIQSSFFGALARCSIIGGGLMASYAFICPPVRNRLFSVFSAKN